MSAEKECSEESHVHRNAVNWQMSNGIQKWSRILAGETEIRKPKSSEWEDGVMEEWSEMLVWHRMDQWPDESNAVKRVLRQHMQAW